MDSKPFLQILSRHLIATVIATSCLLPLIAFDLFKPDAPFKAYRDDMEMLIGMIIVGITSLGTIIECTKEAIKSLRQEVPNEHTLEQELRTIVREEVSNLMRQHLDEIRSASAVPDVSTEADGVTRLRSNIERSTSANTDTLVDKVNLDGSREVEKADLTGEQDVEQDA